MNEFTYKSKDEVWYPDFKSYLFTDCLGGCGCGNSDELAKDVLKVFLAIATKDSSHELIYSDKYHELIAHMLDSAGITEHGSSVGGSWLSSKGKEVYQEYIASKN